MLSGFDNEKVDMCVRVHACVCMCACKCACVCTSKTLIQVSLRTELRAQKGQVLGVNSLVWLSGKYLSESFKVSTVPEF